MKLWLIRHGITEWNEQHRIQGHTDIALSDTGKKNLAELNLPPHWFIPQWYTSPLLRTRQTADILGAPTFNVEPLLAEMRWGEFEGLTLTQIETEISLRKIIPSQGLHFRPTGGETPAEVRGRVDQWLTSLPQTTDQAIAVTHKGVIRAAISLATGWDMEDKFKPTPNWSLPIAFSYDQKNGLQLEQVNYDWNDASLFSA